jgi:hypothetical protein
MFVNQQIQTQWPCHSFGLCLTNLKVLNSAIHVCILVLFFQTNVIIIIIIRVPNNIACTTNGNCRVAATLYTLETWFVSGMRIIISTLYKGYK